MTGTADRRCHACGARTETALARCDCGEPLWIETPATAVSEDWPDGPGPAGSMWRYADLLATDAPGGIGAAAGGTPLVRTPALDGDADGGRVRVKVEGANPTGTFKDRGTALGLAATEGPVGTVSHGNMALSVAATAAGADRPCVVLVPDDIPEGRLGQIAQFDPTLLRVAGDYGRLYERSLAVGADRDVAFLNSDVPLRMEGQKTLAYELCEASAPEVPDAVVLPVSSGGNASAVWKGLRDLRAAGRIDRLPRLCLVQAAACAPIARAFEDGAERVRPLEGGEETVAYSIANADPPSGTRALAAVRATGGTVVAVDDDAIRSARRRFAAETGLGIEPASATTLAALDALGERGAVGAGAAVVLVATGTGFREAPPDPDAASPPDPVGIDDLDARIADLTGFRSG